MSGERFKRMLSVEITFEIRGELMDVNNLNFFLKDWCSEEILFDIS